MCYKIMLWLSTLTSNSVCNKTGECTTLSVQYVMATISRVSRVNVCNRFNELVERYCNKYSTQAEVEAIANRVEHFTGVHVGIWSIELAHSNLESPMEMYYF